MKSILHILCEGQTERDFAKKVLAPYLLPYNIAVHATLLVTNRKKEAEGGISNYAQVKRDLIILMKSNKDGDYEKHYYTTMFDLYALPPNFPGFESAKKDSYNHVQNIETAFEKDVDNCHFIPYIQLHEFEALVICNPDKLKEIYPQAEKEISHMTDAWQNEAGKNPELVNTHYDKVPSRRLINCMQHKYKYNKVSSGIEVTQAIGIDDLRKKCAHFNKWINKLVEIGQHN